MDYLLHVLVLIGIYAILASSLDLLAGQAGILSMAQAAFFGIGAYTTALLAVHLGVSFPLDLIVGMAVAVGLSLAVSLPALRLHDDYLILATFGFQMIVFSVLNNWTGLTGGPVGVPGIPRPTLLGISLESTVGYAVLAVAFSAFAHTAVLRISTSAMGRSLRAIREDEVFAKALGKDTLRLKITTFAVSAALAASAGSIYAHYITFIDPTSFTATESILVVAMVVIGGAGSRWGPVVGAAALVVLPEVLRAIGFSTAVSANLRQILYGVALVAMIALRPRGLVGHYGFRR